MSKKQVNCRIYHLIFFNFILWASLLIISISTDVANANKPESPTKGSSYIWYNGHRPEKVWLSDDEMAVFSTRGSKISKDSLERAVKGVGPGGRVIKQNNFVSYLKLDQKQKPVEIESISKSISQELPVSLASPVFYSVADDHSYPMALTGRIIIKFYPDWSRDKIDTWLRDKGLKILKLFDYSRNTFLIDVGSPLKSLETARAIYLSGEVVYAYPNWVKERAIHSEPTPSAISYPKTAQFWTGSTSGTYGYKQIYIEGPQASEGRELRGFAKFDISAIPDQAIIHKVELHIYCYKDAGQPFVDIWDLNNDPCVVPWEVIFTDAGSGILYVNDWIFSSSNQTGLWRVMSLGESAAADLQSDLDRDWFGVGFVQDEHPTYLAWCYGWEDGIYKPCLTVEYTVPDVPPKHLYYPHPEYYWTGSTSGTYGYNGIFIEGPQAEDGKELRGFAKFDVMDIPDGAVIKDVILHVYCYQDEGQPYIDLRRMAIDPVVADWPDIFAESVKGQLYVDNAVFSDGEFNDGQWIVQSLGAPGAADLRLSLGQDWFAVSLIQDDDPGFMAWCHGWIDGYTMPYIEVEYDDPTPCANDDPLFYLQWHLKNTGQSGGISGADINIDSVWSGYKGASLVIAIVDSEMDISHEDLKENMRPDLCWDYVDVDNDPSPGLTDESEAHATAVAGVAAARGWNCLGGRGAAPLSQLVSYRLIGANTDEHEADALIRNNSVIDIYSNSWGVPDGGDRLDGPGPLTEAALYNGVTNGRGGLGNIYVWAGGNGGSKDNANYDGYANSRYTIAVTVTDDSGKQSGYSEKGACLLVNAPGEGNWDLTTTDRTGPSGYNHGNYTSQFSATSAATPLVAGIIALILEANPDLTWRDVQHILMTSASQNDTSDPDWTVNGAGYHINHKYGFGRIDAAAAVSAALSWASVGEEKSLEAKSQPDIAIPDNDSTGVVDYIQISQELRVEFVEIYFTADDHRCWGDLEIELISPMGTSSILAENHFTLPGSGVNYNNWKFGTGRPFGETSRGTWMLRVKDLSASDVGTLKSWTLKIYGQGEDGPCPEVGVPANPAPGNDAPKLSLDTDLAWSACDNANTYQIYFGTTENPPYYGSTSADLVKEGIARYNLPTLTSNTDYYWQVKAKNNCGNISPGQIWHFTTESIQTPPFSYRATNNYMFIYGQASIDNLLVEPGDWIGVFAPEVVVNNGCIGAFRIEQSGTYIMAGYGDDGTTNAKDGAHPGDTLYFMAWDQSEEKLIELYPQAGNVIWTGNLSTLELGLSDIPPPVTQVIPLAEGWNLISFQVAKCFYEQQKPDLVMVDEEGIGFESHISLMEWLLDPSSSPIRDAADSNLAGDWQRITSFDQNGASILDRQLPSFINNLHYLSVGYGYWIKMNKAGVLMVTGQPSPPDTALHLKSGWNLIGLIPMDICYLNSSKTSEQICPYYTQYYKHEDGIRACAFESLVQTALMNIDGRYKCLTSFDTCHGAMLYDRDLPPIVNTINYIGPKYGYWIKMTEDGDLIFPGDGQ